MPIRTLKPGILMYDCDGHGSNMGVILTEEGPVLIDTGMKPEDTEAVLAEAGFLPGDIKLVINTHSDGDHVGGNVLFNCPIMAHELTFKRMQKRRRLKLPNQTFSDQTVINFGGEVIHLEHKGGHKPDEIIVWLPEHKVLFTGDLIFQGRYPYMVESRVQDWIKVLDGLPEYGAEIIIPGHGTLCSLENIKSLRDYFQNTWERIETLLDQGRSKAEILMDENMPTYEGWDRDFQRNIEIILDQIAEEQAA